MEIIKSFLESSTIHGLTYISTGKKCVRLFWILVLISGFTAAGFMIHRSFKDWDESPVKRTIETRPIKEIKYPKVTVCPPKNTYTNLNYDLVLMQHNTDIDSKIRKELLDYSDTLIFGRYHDSNVRNLSKLQYTDRNYNWYHGYTKITTHLEYAVETCAPNGTMNTQYYGERFNPDYVDTEFMCSLALIPPIAAYNNTNANLYLHVEIMPMKNLVEDDSFKIMSYDDYYQHTVKSELTTLEVCNLLNDKFVNKCNRPNVTVQQNGNVTTVNLEINSEQLGNGIVFLYGRDVKVEEVRKQELPTMPGFRLDWNYSGLDKKPLDLYADDRVTNAFVRYM